jgi:hypothetical protein
MSGGMEIVLYLLLAVPALLVFVIVNLWLCLQVKAVWRILLDRRSGSSGYTSYRSHRSESVKAGDRRINGLGESAAKESSGKA